LSGRGTKVGIRPKAARYEVTEVLGIPLWVLIAIE